MTASGHEREYRTRYGRERNSGPNPGDRPRIYELVRESASERAGEHDGDDETICDVSNDHASRSVRERRWRSGRIAQTRANPLTAISRVSYALALR